MTTSELVHILKNAICSYTANYLMNEVIMTLEICSVGRGEKGNRSTSRVIVINSVRRGNTANTSFFTTFLRASKTQHEQNTIFNFFKHINRDVITLASSDIIEHSCRLINPALVSVIKNVMDIHFSSLTDVVAR